MHLYRVNAPASLVSYSLSRSDDDSQGSAAGRDDGQQLGTAWPPVHRWSQDRSRPEKVGHTHRMICRHCPLAKAR